MSGNRGLANQALFQARILLDAWEREAADGVRTAAQLAGAFRPAVLLHLCRAYGWFLLAIAGLDAQPDPSSLPGRVAAVPPPPPGRALAPELREFALLERDGWVGDMLSADQRAVPTGDTAGAGLLGSDQQAAGVGTLRQWSQQLERLMQRMDDALDEC